MKTGSLSHAETASLGRYTPNSSRIPQTIQKSIFPVSFFFYVVDEYFSGSYWQHSSTWANVLVRAALSRRYTSLRWVQKVIEYAEIQFAWTVALVKHRSKRLAH